VDRNTMSLPWAADPAMGILPVSSKEPPVRGRAAPPGDGLHSWFYP